MAARRIRGAAVLAAAGLLLLALAACGHAPVKPGPETGSAAAAATPAGAPDSAAPVPSRSPWYWPFARRAVPPPQPVDELQIAAGPGSGADFRQFWDRNTLVIDLGSVSGSGSASLTPRAHSTWPVRLEFRVRPGSIGQLEVRGAQRAIFTIEPAGGAPLELDLDPGIYTPRTPALTLVWGP